MPHVDVVSEIKKEYILGLMAEGKRADGRALDTYRDLRIETNLIEQAEGSARVRLGDTDVIVGIKMAIGVPYPDTPGEGVLMTAAELIPMASPEFESGPPRPESIELARVVDRGIRESHTVDMEKLCITPGEKIWMTFIDMHIVDYDGNLFDACSIGVLAALLSATVPASKHGVGEDFPMPIQHYPVMTTAMKIGNGAQSGILFDPGLIEDKVGGPRLSVSHDENGDLRAMQKGLEGGFTKDEVMKILETARAKSAELREIVFKQTGFTPPKKK